MFDGVVLPKCLGWDFNMLQVVDKALVLDLIDL